MSAAVQDRALLSYSVVLLVMTTLVRCFAPVTVETGAVASMIAPLLWLPWVIAHSAVVRGGTSTIRFLLIAVGLAFGFEAVAVNLMAVFHHTVAPQVIGVPLQAVVVRVVYLYAGLTMTLALSDPGKAWQTALPFCLIAAFTTMGLELTADPVSVRLGTVVYHQGGALVPEIVGRGGARGIPLSSLIAEMAVATTAYLAMWWGSRETSDLAPRGRVAAVLFYVTLFLAAAIPAVRLGSSELLLIGGVPVALVSLLVTQRVLVDRRARELALRRSKERARVTNLADRRLAAHRR